MKRKWLGAVTIVVVLSSTITSATSADQVNDVVVFRQSVMQLLDGHVNAIMSIVRGKVDYPEHVAVHAGSIEQLSTKLQDLFPPGTGPDVAATHALPEVWFETDRFAEAFSVLQREATKLAAAARSGDQVAVATEFNSLRRNGCDACHTSFRRRPSQ